MTDLASRIAAASGDASALLALAIALAQENANLAGRAAALEDAERARKAEQAERQRRSRSSRKDMSHDVTGSHVTSRDVTSEAGDGSPLPPVSLLPPTPPNNPSFPPPPSESPVLPAIRVARPRKPAPPAGASWVTEGSTWWHEHVGDVEPPRFGKALKRIVDLFGWPAVFPDLQKWVAERKEIDKPSKAEWYASEASARLTSAAPPMWDPVRKELTAYGERMTRPAAGAR